MNLIVIVLDSFRQDHVSLYNRGDPVFEGVPACKTPNNDKFAESCVVFDNAYPEAFPTIPIRMQLVTGQRTLPYRDWEPLAKQDKPMRAPAKPTLILRYTLVFMNSFLLNDFGLVLYKLGIMLSRPDWQGLSPRTGSAKCLRC